MSNRNTVEIYTIKDVMEIFNLSYSQAQKNVKYVNDKIKEKGFRITKRGQTNAKRYREIFGF